MISFFMRVVVNSMKQFRKSAEPFITVTVDYWSINYMLIRAVTLFITMKHVSFEEVGR